MKIANNTTIANFWRTCVHASLLLCSTCTVLRKGVTQSTSNECYYLQFAIFIFTHKRQQRTVSLLCNCHARNGVAKKTQPNTTIFMGEFEREVTLHLLFLAAASARVTESLGERVVVYFKLCDLQMN